MSKRRLAVVIIVSIITFALLVSVFVTMFNDTFLTFFGNKFASAARVLDESFPNTIESDLAYGKILCYGYLGIFPLGLLMISCLLRDVKKRVSNIFLALFIVLSVVADVVFLVLTRNIFPTIREIDLPGETYKVLRFIPIPVLFATYLVGFSRVYIYYVLPLLAQILLVLTYTLLRRFKTRVYEFLNFAAFLILVAFIPILENYVFITAIVLIVTIVILWAIKGFFTVDTGSVIRMSDGTVLHHVDGDTYSDGNGNYYRSDGNGGFHLK